jgi:chemotaxis protein MotA
MGSLGGPPEEIGTHVAAALVGTFLGILLCYGLVGPLASNMSKIVDEEHSYYLKTLDAVLDLQAGMCTSCAVSCPHKGQQE